MCVLQQAHHHSQHYMYYCYCSHVLFMNSCNKTWWCEVKNPDLADTL